MKKFENIIVLLTGISGIGKRTIGQAMCTVNPSFRCVLSDSWQDPILRLLGDDSTVMNTLTSESWTAINKIRDVVFDTIANVCPREFNFVITEELTEGNIWHKNFFERAQLMTQKRNAKLIPVRLFCELPVLLQRVVSEDRKNFLKPRDIDFVKNRFSTTETFKSKNKDEFTLDTTNLSPRESAEKILQHLEDIF